MSLLERLEQDMKQAMKDKDKFRLSVIRMIRSAIKNKEISEQRVPDEGEVLDILNREVKQRKDSLQDFEKAGREDLVEQVQKEIEVIMGYLPKQLSEEEVEALVKQTIQDVGASSKADMGKVMGALMPKIKGRAEDRKSVV